ncbi:LOW QUALITY PROTEIN: hypothetical protein Cgig2_010926 [Carnegiea gigantea]|uniref:Uncharacterized protein n=1 Tax=Carnegiea gigantea TaxID=171969 RepID=A0A9Q1K357_9CARY|nr:LOW QUALITY PROTEIN: hypothetical protein Cgig2_010926 [Carnegiea gigantea]
MALYMLGNFEWYRKEVVFPPRPLPSDYEELCPGFVLAAAEEYAWDYEVPELPYVVFLAMLLNDGVKLGILHGWMIGIMESALKRVAVEHLLGMGRAQQRILEAHRQEASSDSEEEESSRSDDQTPISSDGSEDARLQTSRDGPATFYAMLLCRIEHSEQNDSGKERERERDRRKPIMFPNFLSTKQVAKYVRDKFLLSSRESSTLWPNLLLKTTTTFALTLIFSWPCCMPTTPTSLR